MNPIETITDSIKKDTLIDIDTIDNIKRVLLTHYKITFLDLEKVLKLDNPELFFLLLDDFECLEKCFPELANLKGQLQPVKWHPEQIYDLEIGLNYQVNRNTGILDNDSFVHTLLVLREACVHTDDLIIRFASLTHDFGKALTSIEKLPSHINHEKLGVPLVVDFCYRLGVTEEWERVAVMTTREHLNIHRFDNLNDKTIIKLFERCDAFERPEEFRKMIFASICDANGRGRFCEKVSYDKVDYIMGLVKLLTTNEKIVNMSQQKYRDLLNKINNYRKRKI